MKVRETSLPGVLLIEPDIYPDARGFFLETFHVKRYAEAGITRPFVQDNMSSSVANVLRGLHFQYPNPQAKLVHTAKGEIFDVAVDIRTGSPTFGKWFGTRLSCETGHQLMIPAGFAHGFCVLSETARIVYKCDAYFEKAADRAIAWNDPDIGIDWPITAPVLSDKDAAAPRLRDIDRALLPTFA
jgi:dTDP-4-dehydrorhamnose 3,5-epimerase